jgi:hypothetical protein
MHLTLDQESALVLVVRKFELKPRDGIRQDKRFANLQVFDNKRAPIELLSAGFKYHFDKRRCREHH